MILEENLSSPILYIVWVDVCFLEKVSSLSESLKKVLCIANSKKRKKNLKTYVERNQRQQPGLISDPARRRRRKLEPNLHKVAKQMPKL